MTKFFISDTHFNHSRILEFSADCRKFDNILEHDEFIVQRWNSVVSKNDTVYHLGDLMMEVNDDNYDEVAARTIARLNGKIRLVVGNHDTNTKIKNYKKHIDDIVGYFEFYPFKAIVSHIPVHTSQLEERFRWNIHGHVHAHSLPDSRYLNVSCENINFTPISVDEIKLKFFKKDA